MHVSQLFIARLRYLTRACLRKDQSQRGGRKGNVNQSGTVQLACVFTAKKTQEKKPQQDLSK